MWNLVVSCYSNCVTAGFIVRTCHIQICYGFPSFHPLSMHVTKSHHFYLLHIIILFPLHLFCLLCGVCFESREMHNLRKWKDDSNFFSLSSSPALLGFYRLVTTRERQRELRMETDYAMTSWNWSQKERRLRKCMQRTWKNGQKSGITLLRKVS